MAELLGDVDLGFVDAIVVPASVHDLDGRFLAVNQGGVDASGRSRAELMAGRYTDSLTPETKALVEALFQRVLRECVPVEFHTVFVDGSGHRRAVRALHSPLLSNGEVAGVLILAFEAFETPRDPQRIPTVPRISARRRETLELVASGLSTNEIADRLSITPATVRNHLRNLLQQLDAHSRVEAVVAAQRIGLLSARPLAPAEE
jgi:PAS domain S-box-containing protein